MLLSRPAQRSLGSEGEAAAPGKAALCPFTGCRRFPGSADPTPTERWKTPAAIVGAPAPQEGWGLLQCAQGCAAHGCSEARAGLCPQLSITERGKVTLSWAWQNNATQSSANPSESSWALRSACHGMDRSGITFNQNQMKAELGVQGRHWAAVMALAGPCHFALHT